MNVQSQLITMVFLMGCGVWVGFLFDVFRGVARYYLFSRWILTLSDGLYWLIVFVFFIIALDRSTDGEIRAYLWFSIGIGFGMYFLLISRMMLRGIQVMIYGFDQLVQVIWKIGYYTIILPCKGVLLVINIFIGFFISIAIFLNKIMIQLVWHPSHKCLVIMSKFAKKIVYRDRLKTYVQYVIRIWKK